MKRREFITLLAGAAAAWPLAAWGQQAIRVIGLLNGQSSAGSTNYIAAFRGGLAEAGFVEGRNLAIVYRSAEGNAERLPALAAELVSLQVAVIAGVGGDISARAAKAATGTIPIVFLTGGDPVAIGFVPSLARPGGNMTGVTFMGSVIASKLISILRDLLPGLTTIGLLVNPANPMTPAMARDVQAAVQAVGVKAVVAEVSSERDIDTAFERFVAQHVDAVVIGSAAFFNAQRDRLIGLASQRAIPAIFSDRSFAAAGGLMSYGASVADAYRQAGAYVGRILKGATPADLPVQQAAKFEFVINLKTAKALGLMVRPRLLATADEVIE
jgi:putative tryptophan/tyrosine transport system substrate-binding protein